MSFIEATRNVGLPRTLREIPRFSRNDDGENLQVLTAFAGTD